MKEGRRKALNKDGGSCWGSDSGYLDSNDSSDDVDDRRDDKYARESIGWF